MQRETALALTRFGIVGGVNALMGYALFLSGLAAGANYVTSNIGAWIACVIFGYVSHRRITFGRRDDRAGAFGRFVGLSLFNLGLAVLSLATLIDFVHLAPWIAYPINIILTATVSFVIMNQVVFRQPKPAETRSR